MCYSRCPFENSFTGECSNPSKNALSLSAHCNNGFVCTHCKEERAEDEYSEFDGICVECADQYFQCASCGEVKEKEYEQDENAPCFCIDCVEEGKEENARAAKLVEENYLAPDNF